VGGGEKEGLKGGREGGRGKETSAQVFDDLTHPLFFMLRSGVGFPEPWLPALHRVLRGSP
jgi:hypothetical protein